VDYVILKHQLRSEKQTKKKRNQFGRSSFSGLGQWVKEDVATNLVKFFSPFLCFCRWV